MSAERALYQHADQAAADARADADVAAGRLVDHADVAAWLVSWGTADEVPAPAVWLA